MKNNRDLTKRQLQDMILIARTIELMLPFMGIATIVMWLVLSVVDVMFQWVALLVFAVLVIALTVGVMMVEHTYQKCLAMRNKKAVQRKQKTAQEK